MRVRICIVVYFRRVAVKMVEQKTKGITGSSYYPKAKRASGDTQEKKLVIRRFLYLKV